MPHNLLHPHSWEIIQGISSLDLLFHVDPIKLIGLTFLDTSQPYSKASYSICRDVALKEEADPATTVLRLGGSLTALHVTLFSPRPKRSRRFVMVGIPGKSKGCHTCRKRKIRVGCSQIMSGLTAETRSVD